MTEQRLQAHPRAKVVCVGRNYAAHANELGNAVPKQPMLFIKPSTAIAPFAGEYRLPAGEPVHYELELALLVGEPIGADEPDPMSRISGVGLGLDLTRRELQGQLKAEGKPWERAKGFDRSCLLGSFVPMAALSWPLDFSLHINGELKQQGVSADMVFAPGVLLSAIAADFSLLAGDVVLTGTPAGVGSLAPGDYLLARLGSVAQAELRCVAAGTD